MFSWNSRRKIVTLILYLQFVLQGEGNLKFVLYTMKALQPAIPSLTSIKNFKLPIDLEPQQVLIVVMLTWSFTDLTCSMLLYTVQNFTAEGVPFYINSLIGILKVLYRVPGLVTKMTRYPDQSDDVK